MLLEITRGEFTAQVTITVTVILDVTNLIEISIHLIEIVTFNV